MENGLVSIITAQTGILFQNIDETLKGISENQLYDQGICDWPLAEQLYHLLHSLDNWFINPAEFRESPIAAKKAKSRLTLSDLRQYRNAIEQKIDSYLETLSDGRLSEYPEGCRFNRLTLVLGQYRHLMYHIGLIHGCLRVHSAGNNPAYHGLGQTGKLEKGGANE